MAFEKGKVIKAAEKFLAQGKISAAIKEYRQIIQNDQDDLTTLNMLGDLLARAGKSKDALKVLHKIADLDPQNTEIRLKLAEGYLKEHMDGDAAKAYGEAAV